MELHPGDDFLETERTVLFLKNHIFSDNICFVARQILITAYRRDGLEMKDCDDRYPNDCTWIVLQSACSTSFHVRIESSCRCMSILLRYGRSIVLSSSSAQKLMKGC